MIRSNIIRLELDDVNKLMNIRETHIESKEERNTFENSMVGYIENLKEGNRITFVYTENDEFIAECSLGVNYDEPDFTIDKTRICLSFMMVKKYHMNNGIGSKLLAHVFDFAKQNGYSEISLEVNINNYSALHLYIKHGFNYIIRDIKVDENNSLVLLKKLR